MSTKSVPVLTLEGARRALEGAEARAKACILHAIGAMQPDKTLTAQAINTPMNIAVVDSACHLLAFARMDGAKITSISIAVDKAFTAAGHGAPTSVYREAVWPGGPAFGIGHSNGGRFMTIAGGVPILRHGVVVGAVGCSTGTPAQDEDVARGGVDAVGRSFGERAKL